MKQSISRRPLVAAVAAAALLMAGGAFAASNAGAASSEHTAATAQKSPVMNWYGGPAYLGQPALKATAAFVDAGGGVKDFSTAKALTSMLGEKTVHAEVAKLTKQYGEKNVKDWLTGFDFVVDDAVKIVSAAGVKLPDPPASLHGVALAKTLVKAGTAPDGVFWSGRLYDVAVSHKVHNQVMMDIDAKQGGGYDGNVHRITNQAMYDVAQALGMKDVKLAAFH